LVRREYESSVPLILDFIPFLLWGSYIVKKHEPENPKADNGMAAACGEQNASQRPISSLPYLIEYFGCRSLVNRIKLTIPQHYAPIIEGANQITYVSTFGAEHGFY
jgi:hypothetical protein